MTTTRKPSLFNRVGGFIDYFGSATAIAGAIDGSRQPKARDLERLGIDPEQFRSIGRF